MLKKLLFCVGLCALALQPVLAQQDYNNSLTFSTGGFLVTGIDNQIKSNFFKSIKTFDDLTFKLTMQTSYSYRRKIYKNLSAGISYNKWKGTERNHKFGILYATADSPVKGTPLEYDNFKMIDVSVFYRVRLNRNEVLAGLGMSYIYGDVTYIDHIYINPDPPYDGIIYSITSRKRYYGVTPSVSYNYYLLKNRVNVGADLRYRFCNSLGFAQVDYMIHAGVNF
jgi:hypothetical protein